MKIENIMSPMDIMLKNIMMANILVILKIINFMVKVLMNGRTDDVTLVIGLKIR